MNIFKPISQSDEALLKGMVGDGILQRTTENRLHEQYFYFIKAATFKYKISKDVVDSVYTYTIQAFSQNVKKQSF